MSQSQELQRVSLHGTNTEEVERPLLSGSEIYGDHWQVDVLNMQGMALRETHSQNVSLFVGPINPFLSLYFPWKLTFEVLLEVPQCRHVFL